MILKTMTLILAVVGLIVVFAGLIIGMQNSGSCPAQKPGCDHTFSGTDIWIGATSKEVTRVGLFVLAGALVAGVAWPVRRVQISASPC